MIIEGFPEGTGYQCHYSSRVFGCASVVFAKEGQCILDFVGGKAVRLVFEMGWLFGFLFFSEEVGGGWSLPCLLNCWCVSKRIDF